jgi:hypothetical protein
MKITRFTVVIAEQILARMELSSSLMKEQATSDLLAAVEPARDKKGCEKAAYCMTRTP